MKPLNVSANANTAVIEAAYEAWLKQPDSVDPTWRAFFQGFTLGTSGGSLGTEGANLRIIDSYKQAQVGRFINAHRAHGHLQAHLDPLGEPPPADPKLTLSYFGLDENDLGESFTLTNFKGGGQMKLRDIVDALRQTYCGHIGVEYMHVQEHAAREWLQVRMEQTNNQPRFSRAEKIRILRRLHKAELFEKFLHTKYVGQKRFSGEGAETFIAAIDAMLEKCPELGVEEIVMGMAHRGRLNVLTSIMRKPFEVLFEQFSENYLPESVAGDGDVKYHLGYEAILDTSSGQKVEIRLAANPSHLEIVDPVVEGKARARQRVRHATSERQRVLPFLIHGDAAFAGQGIVAETLNFSQLPGYTTGGTVHLVINNQIGFTTLPHEARSTRYCTDVAKMVEAPIFHVNGDDAEAVCLVAQLALEFRVRFQRDVVIDMVCYRKHGHNEADEPAFTQPVLYRQIAAHPLVSSILTEKLVREGTITPDEAEAIKAEYTAALEANFERAKAREKEKEGARSVQQSQAIEREKFKGSTAFFQPAYRHSTIDTGAEPALINRVVAGLTTIPGSFKLNPKIRRFLDNRIRAHREGGPIDWGFGEALAFGTLLLDGTPIRLSGQDCERGTFSHRHAVLYDVDTREQYVPLKNLDPQQPAFCVYNSLLSEAGVLGFDYGYSMDYPQMLCIWEAQFGDFVNGAQVVIDQFIASSESKWQRASGIVLLLPHGYEGQGPEHSSARLERFLGLCAEDNIQVTNITTPANFFHLLRRQMKRDFRKPLVVMSPKSLLRHPACVSRLDEFTSGRFQEVLDDPKPPAKVERVIYCSGKVYYDLCDFRDRHHLNDVAIVRIEQLYPLHRDRLAAVADRYNGARIVWCQEEPQNMGAWTFIAPRLAEIYGFPPKYAGRDAAASPAVGALALHKFELNALLQDAFNI
ncbi:2-oxoglutarate dehydrogenase E1 component [Opitutus terrae]|uniref:2-oxoglutarate dehydrogenase E1 component n=1 Tax=Opitutus terrae (strain DSM 11246 / JCM 15787 / PB90-1) TaxID=452637 RepID=B1ZNX4_OPITP|nr:2-oxoglutarate dehydrogenase E1 component [Opitutus terrae]ACB77463.1 2-oxoglutarate dehydrogenase, E1 subunit [Opitutus terrae PB90-1]